MEFSDRLGCLPYPTLLGCKGGSFWCKAFLGIEFLACEWFLYCWYSNIRSKVLLFVQIDILLLPQFVDLDRSEKNSLLQVHIEQE